MGISISSLLLCGSTSVAFADLPMLPGICGKESAGLGCGMLRLNYSADPKDLQPSLQVFDLPPCSCLSQPGCDCVVSYNGGAFQIPDNAFYSPLITYETCYESTLAVEADEIDTTVSNSYSNHRFFHSRKSTTTVTHVVQRKLDTITVSAVNNFELYNVALPFFDLELLPVTDYFREFANFYLAGPYSYDSMKPFMDGAGSDVVVGVVMGGVVTLNTWIHKCFVEKFDQTYTVTNARNFFFNKCQNTDVRSGVDAVFVSTSYSVMDVVGGNTGLISFDGYDIANSTALAAWMESVRTLPMTISTMTVPMEDVLRAGNFDDAIVQNYLQLVDDYFKRSNNDLDGVYADAAAHHDESCVPEACGGPATCPQLPDPFSGWMPASINRSDFQAAYTHNVISGMLEPLDGTFAPLGGLGSCNGGSSLPSAKDVRLALNRRSHRKLN